MYVCHAFYTGARCGRRDRSAYALPHPSAEHRPGLISDTTTTTNHPNSNLCNQLNGHKTIASIRREMASLSERAVAVVVEVLWDTLPSSRSASYLFVDQILREQDSACHELHNRSSSSGIGGAVTSSNLLDLAVLLIAAPVSGDINRKTLALVRGWLDRGAFPFGPLREVLGMRSQVLLLLSIYLSIYLSTYLPIYLSI